jgi:hypothetical protein
MGNITFLCRPHRDRLCFYQLSLCSASLECYKPFYFFVEAAAQSKLERSVRGLDSSRCKNHRGKNKLECLFLYFFLIIVYSVVALTSEPTIRVDT